MLCWQPKILLGLGFVCGWVDYGAGLHLGGRLPSQQFGTAMPGRTSCRMPSAPVQGAQFVETPLKILASSNGETDLPQVVGGLDGGAIAKYAVAVMVQMGVLGALFAGLDQLSMAAGVTGKVPSTINAFGFYFLALKSRVFNPMSNRRPKRPPSGDDDGMGDDGPVRKMPSWTPPGFVFPIVWLLIIGPLRAVSSALVVQASGGTYFTPALLSLMLHLSIGDVWNTINNVEKRYGTSVLGVALVWISAAFAARQFYLLSPLAGKLLSIPLVWLSIASSLIFRTWKINPDPVTGLPAPLLPIKGDNGAETKLLWFSS